MKGPSRIEQQREVAVVRPAVPAQTQRTGQPMANRGAGESQPDRLRGLGL